MTTVVSRQRVIIEGDNLDFDEALQKTRQTADRFASRLATRMATATAAVNLLADAAKQAFASINRAFNETRNEIDALAKTSSKLSITTEALAGLDLQAEKSGLRVNALRIGLQRATRRISEAAQATGEVNDELSLLRQVSGGVNRDVGAGAAGTARALRELNVDIQALVRLSPDKQLETLADAFQGVGNGADKVRLAFALFDSEGVGILNVIQNGSEAMREQTRRAIDLGLALNRIEAARVEAANDAILELERSTTGLLRQFTVEAAPLAETLATLFASSREDVVGWRNIFRTSVDVAVEGIGLVGTAFKLLSAAVNGSVATVTRAWATGLNTISGPLERILGFTDRITGGLSFAGTIRDTIAGARTELDALSEAFAEGARQNLAASATFTQNIRDQIDAIRRRNEAQAQGVGSGGQTRAELEALRKEREAAGRALLQLESDLRTQREAIEVQFQQRQRQIQAAAALGSLRDAAELDELLIRARADRNRRLAELDAQQSAGDSDSGAQARLDALLKSVQTEREVITSQFAERQLLLREFRAQDLIDEEEQTVLLLQIRAQRNEALFALDERLIQRQKAQQDKARRAQEAADRKLSQTRLRDARAVAGGLINIGDAIGRAADGQNRSALAAQKAFAVAGIAVNTALGASRAIAELGPIAGPIAAAGIIAAGAASIGSVIATEIGSPGGAASVGKANVGTPGIGSADVCSTVEQVRDCGGSGLDTGSDGRAGTEGIQVANIIQFGDAQLSALVDEIRRRIDDDDLVLFTPDSAQAQVITAGA